MKTKIILSVLVLFAVVCLLSAVSCLAAVPSLINYQGVLKDSTGVPINDDVIMVFSIWDDSTNGNKLWEELQSIVHVNHGLFNVLLGSSTRIPDTIFADTNTYLQVQVNTSVLQPRRRIVSVGYANKAANADQVDGKDYNSTDLKPFGSWENRSEGPVYQADTDGFVVVVAHQDGSGNAGLLKFYSDSNNPPTTIRGGGYYTHDTTNFYNCFMSPVKKNDYYKLIKDGALTGVTIEGYYWIPMGQ
jgi:hypothetical protein